MNYDIFKTKNLHKTEYDIIVNKTQKCKYFGVLAYFVI